MFGSIIWEISSKVAATEKSPPLHCLLSQGLHFLVLYTGVQARLHAFCVEFLGICNLFIEFSVNFIVLIVNALLDGLKKANFLQLLGNLFLSIV